MNHAADWIRLRWQKGSRYYEAHLHQDLWGNWVVTRVWGQQGTRKGRVMHVICQSVEEGRDLLRALDRSRRRRGYLRQLMQGRLDLD